MKIAPLEQSFEQFCEQFCKYRDDLLGKKNLQAAIRLYLEVITSEKFPASWRDFAYEKLLESINEQSEILGRSERLISATQTILQQANVKEPACLKELKTIPFLDQEEPDLPSGEAYFLVVSKDEDVDSTAYAPLAWLKKVKVFYGDDERYVKATDVVYAVVKRSRVYVKGYLAKKHVPNIELSTGWWFDDPDDRASYIEYDEESHGLAVAVAYAALLLNLEVPSDVAMTGELDSNGGVISVGGIEEKLSAAYYWPQPKISKVIIPKGNRDVILDFRKDHPDPNFEIIPVDNFEQCLNVVFGKAKIDKAIESVVGIKGYLEGLEKQYRETTAIDNRWRLNFDEEMYIPMKVREVGLGFESREIAEENGGIGIQDVLNQYRQVVILGQLGAGKTSLLKYITFNLARQYLDDVYQEEIILKDDKGRPEKPIPIFISLLDLQSKSIALSEFIDKLHKQFPSSAIPEELSAAISKKIKSGDCIFLLDGYDEVSEETQSEVNKMVMGNPQSRFIVASRGVGNIYQFPCQHFVELIEFSNSQIEDFISKRFADDIKKGQKLLQKIRNDTMLRNLSRVPLLLGLITYIQKKEDPSKLHNRKVDLYSQFSNILLEELEASKRGVRRSRTTKPQKESLIKTIAHRFFKQNSFDDREVEADAIPLACQMSQLDIDTIVYDEIKELTGLLGEESDGIYKFNHTSFKEYYAAKYIKDYGVTEELLERLGDGRWAGVIEFYCGMLNEPKLSDFVRKVFESDSDRIFKSHIILSGKCLSAAPWQELEDALEDNIIDSLFDLYRDGSGMLSKMAFDVLTEIKNDKVIDRFVKLISLDDNLRNADACIAIGRLGEPDSKQIIQILSQIIDDQVAVSDNLRKVAVESLNNIGGVKVNRILISALKNANLSCLHQNIAWVFRNTADDGVVEQLMKIVEDHTESDYSLFIAKLVCETLGKIGSHKIVGGDKIVDFLIEIVDTSERLRETALNALGDTGSEKACEYLIDKFPECDNKVGEALLKNLGKLKNKKSAALLRNVLESGDVMLKKPAIEALAAIGTDEEIDVLIDFFEKDMRDSSDVKLKILEEIGFHPKFHGCLLNCLSGQQLDIIRWTAVKLIAQRNVFRGDMREGVFEQILNLLSKATKDEERICAIEALANLTNGANSEIFSLKLFEYLSSPKSSTELQRAAICGLCQIHAAQSDVLGLARLYRDYGDDYAKAHVLSALGKLIEAVSPRKQRLIADVLIDAATNGDYITKKEAIKVMKFLDADNGSRALCFLENRIQDPDYDFLLDEMYETIGEFRMRL